MSSPPPRGAQPPPLMSDAVKERFFKELLAKEGRTQRSVLYNGSLADKLKQANKISPAIENILSTDLSRFKERIRSNSQNKSGMMSQSSFKFSGFEHLSHDSGVAMRQLESLAKGSMLSQQKVTPPTPPPRPPVEAVEAETSACTSKQETCPAALLSIHELLSKQRISSREVIQNYIAGNESPVSESFESTGGADEYVQNIMSNDAATTSPSNETAKQSIDNILINLAEQVHHVKSEYKSIHQKIVADETERKDLVKCLTTSVNMLATNQSCSNTWQTCLHEVRKEMEEIRKDQQTTRYLMVEVLKTLSATVQQREDFSNNRQPCESRAIQTDLLQTNTSKADDETAFDESSSTITKGTKKDDLLERGMLKLKDQVNDLTNQLSIKEQQIADHIAVQKSLEASLEQKKQEISLKNQQLTIQSNQKADFINKFEQEKSRMMDVLCNKERSLKETILHLEVELKSSQSAMHTLRRDLTTKDSVMFEKAQQREEQIVSQYKFEHAQLQASINAKERHLNEALMTVRHEADDKARELYKANLDIERLEDLLEKAEEQIKVQGIAFMRRRDELTADLDSEKLKNMKLAGERDNLTQEIKSAKDLITQHVIERDQLSEELRQNKENHKHALASIDQHDCERDQLSEKLRQSKEDHQHARDLIVQKSLDIENYQVDIKQLTDRINDLSDQNGKLRGALANQEYAIKLNSLKVSLDKAQEFMELNRIASQVTSSHSSIDQARTHSMSQAALSFYPPINSPHESQPASQMESSIDIDGMTRSVGRLVSTYKLDAETEYAIQKMIASVLDLRKYQTINTNSVTTMSPSSVDNVAINKSNGSPGSITSDTENDCKHSLDVTDSNNSTKSINQALTKYSNAQSSMNVTSSKSNIISSASASSCVSECKTTSNTSTVEYEPTTSSQNFLLGSKCDSRESKSFLNVTESDPRYINASAPPESDYSLKSPNGTNQIIATTSDSEFDIVIDASSKSTNDNLSVSNMTNISTSPHHQETEISIAFEQPSRRDIALNIDRDSQVSVESYMLDGMSCTTGAITLQTSGTDNDFEMLIENRSIEGHTDLAISIQGSASKQCSLSNVCQSPSYNRQISADGDIKHQIVSAFHTDSQVSIEPYMIEGMKNSKMGFHTQDKSVLENIAAAKQQKSTGVDAHKDIRVQVSSKDVAVGPCSDTVTNVFTQIADTKDIAYDKSNTSSQQLKTSPSTFEATSLLSEATVTINEYTNGSESENQYRLVESKESLNRIITETRHKEQTVNTPAITDISPSDNENKATKKPRLSPEERAIREQKLIECQRKMFRDMWADKRREEEEDRKRSAEKRHETQTDIDPSTPTQLKDEDLDGDLPSGGKRMKQTQSRSSTRINSLASHSAIEKYRQSTSQMVLENITEQDETVEPIDPTPVSFEATQTTSSSLPRENSLEKSKSKTNTGEQTHYLYGSRSGCIIPRIRKTEQQLAKMEREKARLRNILAEDKKTRRNFLDELSDLSDDETFH